MTPEQLAKIHQASIATPAPWSATEFQQFLCDETVGLVAENDGFILFRIVADEAEILTLAVHPKARRRGKAKNLLKSALSKMQENGAQSAFLEVAATNSPAINLYENALFQRVGTRKGYYRTADGSRTDAIVMSRNLDLSTG